MRWTARTPRAIEGAERFDPRNRRDLIFSVYFEYFIQFELVEVRIILCRRGCVIGSHLLAQSVKRIDFHSDLQGVNLQFAY